MINLNTNIKKWFEYNWIDEVYLTNLEKKGIITKEEYYSILSSIENVIEEDLLQKIVTITSTVN